MAHTHIVYDADPRFTIDPLTRVVTNQSTSKTMIMQNDHNSERFSFQMPRYVEEHDMLSCNRVQVHFINIGGNQRNIGVYEVTDMHASPDDDKTIVCSWLVSRNATQLVGTLNFVIRFACVTDGELDYVWNTAVHGGIAISAGIDNSDEFVDQYQDVLEQWYAELVSAGSDSVQRINAAEATALQNIADSGGVVASDTEPTGDNISAWIESSGDQTTCVLVEERDLDQLSNTLKGTASGEVIRVDDVSPVEHAVKAKVHQKNLLPEDFYDLSKWLPGEPNQYVFPLDITEGTYTLSGVVDGDVADKYFYIQKSIDGWFTTTTSYVITPSQNQMPYTFEVGSNCECRLFWYGSNFEELVDMMLEEGDTATEYTPWVDPSTVTVTRCGKNLFDTTKYKTRSATANGVTVDMLDDGCIYVHGTPIDSTNVTSITVTHYQEVDVFPKGTYIYSNNPSVKNDNVLCFPQANKPDNGAWIVNFLNAGTHVSEEFCINRFVIHIKAGTTDTINMTFRIQVEAGEHATEYEAYKSISTHTPEPDGTVNGILSLSPTMILLTDTPGVTIEAEYNQDINSAFDKIDASGKVDKITDNWKAYTTDGSGKTVAKPLTAKPSSGGVVLYNEYGIVKTNAPVEDNDAANKKFVEDGLAGKLDAILPSEVTAEYAYTVTPYGNGKRFMSGVENGNGNIVVYRTVSDTDKKDKGATINVTTPVYPYNAANKKYVDDGLGGKVDRLEQALSLYGTKGVGEDGKIIHEPYSVDIAAIKAGVVLQASPPTNSSFDRKVPTATFAVCDPQKPYQPATKQYVDNGFVPRSKLGWALYGTNGTPDENGYMGNRAVYVSCLGTQANCVAVYQQATNATQFADDKEPICTIAVADPVKPIQAANKRFVEDAIDKATANIREAAVGTLYTTQQVHNMNEKAPIPTGALPYAYLEHVDEYCMVGSRDSDGSPTMVGQAKVLEIRQTSDMSSELATMPPTIGQYFKLEDGATHLYLVLGDVEFFDPNNIYYNEFFVTTSVLYQVKVGG